MFADDCVLYYTGKHWNNVYNKLQSDLDRLLECATQHSLSLNGKKLQAMIVRTRNAVSKLHNIVPFKIGNTKMKYVKQYNFLGVILDAELSLVPLC